ncbi:MAG: complex I subunit 5 family protein [Gammaproteobacteria bacterium]
MADKLLIALVALPLLGALWAALQPRRGALVGTLVSLALAVVALQATVLVAGDGTIRHVIGGWQSGLGIALRMDALAAPFIVLNAVVALAGSVYASRYFPAHRATYFWPQWLMLLTALNALVLADDLFNIYVALELLGLSAVGLAAMGHGSRALSAALRYLAVGLVASMLYLAGVALMYFSHGTLDIPSLSALVAADAGTGNEQAQASGQGLALALISAGLMMKAALFPLHFWLPPAHGSAPAPVSAVLSALVVKAAWYLMLRLWLELFEPVIGENAARWLAVLAAAGVLWGSWQALRAPRLKLVAAYSSIAQLGYLFLAIPLLLALPAGGERQALLAAVVVFAQGHGLAKAALFLAAGVIQQRAGHDDIARLGGTVQCLPATAFTLGLAGAALIGLPPSGAFLGKWFLLDSAIGSGQGWIALVILAGSLLAGAYVFRFISHAFGHKASPGKAITLAREEWPALLLALGATVLLGLGAAPVWTLLETPS